MAKPAGVLKKLASFKYISLELSGRCVPIALLDVVLVVLKSHTMAVKMKKTLPFIREDTKNFQTPQGQTAYKRGKENTHTN